MIVKVLVVLGLGLLGLAWAFAAPVKAYTWPSIEGVVTGPSADPQGFNYRYVVGDLALVNYKVEHHWATDTPQMPPIGTRLDVYYNPANPDDSFVGPDPTPSRWALVAAVLCFVAAASIIALGPRPSTKSPGERRDKSVPLRF